MVLDSLNDAVVVCDAAGTVRHANPAAERLLGWSADALWGRSATEFVPSYVARQMAPGFAAFVEQTAAQLAGRPVALSLRHQDGGEVPTDVVLSVVDHPLGGWAVVAIIRPRSDRRLYRWNQLTSDLLEILASAPVGEPPAERLLSTLGHRLHWDVVTLWAIDSRGELLCRHVWARDPGVGTAFVQEKARDATSGADGLPRWVIEHGEPLWVPDLLGDERFSTDAVRKDALRSAYAFPIRYRGVCVGVIKMLSRRVREPDPGLVEVMTGVSDHLGELLDAFAQATAREQLVSELEAVRRSQEFLLLASRVLSDATDYRQTVDRLAQVAVPVLADLCLIDVHDEHGAIERMAAWHADPAKRALTEELRTNYAPDPHGIHPSVDVMQSGRSRWDPEMTDEFLAATTRDERHLSIVKALEFTSYMTVPLKVASGVLGTVTLVSAGSGRRFTEHDLALAEELAAQVATVVERARILDREQRISHELQQNLLPDEIPRVKGWSFAARYVPAGEGVQVGGDWFDVIGLGRDAVALVVGDVEGHDMDAAKAMGRLRHVLSLLMLEERSPGAALERLNHFVLSTDGDRIATVLAGVLDTQRAVLTVASAGHPAALAIDGRAVREASVRPGPPLGVPGGVYEEASLVLGDATLLMFTDGLVERPEVDYDDSLGRLREVLASSPSAGPEKVADHVLSGMFDAGAGSDDVVLLVARRRLDRTEA
jgi:PAS domain S-box-containing protein